MSTTPRLKQLLIEVVAKHLPPSASTLRLLDVNGEAGAILSNIRQDLEIVSISGNVDQWRSVPAESADAVVAYGYVLNDRFLAAAHDALRPGGRLILVNSEGGVTEALGKRIEDGGFTRILVETAVECPLPTGVLMRGEKPHTTVDTLERIRLVAEPDSQKLNLQSYEGRYVHLLVVQTPNKPAWAIAKDDQVEWQAAALMYDNGPALLAFSSLPKAVEFMQPAVLAGRIHGVNRITKYRKAIAGAWNLPVLLNPSQDVLDNGKIVFIPVDPGEAEAPNE